MSDPLLTRQELRKLRENEGERQQQVKQDEGHWRSFKDKPSQAADGRVAENHARRRDDDDDEFAPKDFSNEAIDRAVENDRRANNIEPTRQARRAENECDRDLSNTQGYSDAELEDLQLTPADIRRLKEKLAEEERAPVFSDDRNQADYASQNNYNNGPQNGYPEAQPQKKNKFRPNKESRTVEGEKSRERNHTLNVAIVIVVALLAVLIYLIFNW